MQASEIEQFVHENEWINAARVVSTDSETQTYRVNIELSPSGHGLIRDRGMPELEQRLQSSWRHDDTTTDTWDFRADRSGPGWQNIPEEGPDFPAVLSRLDDNSTYRWLLDISPELDWFRGHFPGNPVLPGVVQLHWAVKVAQAIFGLTGAPAEIKRLKFKSIVMPPRIVELSVFRSSENEVQFEFISMGQQHSEGRLVFVGGSSC
jgi:3-hydroxymyristoyl/3-hydroxydecanoyl-(acyl carrier protein) dehydratase